MPDETFSFSNCALFLRLSIVGAVREPPLPGLRTLFTHWPINIGRSSSWNQREKNLFIHHGHGLNFQEPFLPGQILYHQKGGGRKRRGEVLGPDFPKSRKIFAIL